MPKHLESLEPQEGFDVWGILTEEEKREIEKYHDSLDDAYFDSLMVGCPTEPNPPYEGPIIEIEDEPEFPLAM